jgi:CheY-like chemotaxis protein
MNAADLTMDSQTQGEGAAGVFGIAGMLIAVIRGKFGCSGFRPVSRAAREPGQVTSLGDENHRNQSSAPSCFLGVRRMRKDGVQSGCSADRNVAVGEWAKMRDSRKFALVIDIDVEFLLAIERLLEEHGVDTTTTWDMREGLRLLSSKPFDVVLVCHHPPEVHASEILRSNGAGAPAYLVLQPTSRVLPDSRVFLAQGAQAVLHKWSQDEILQQVKRCLAGAEEAASLRRAS